MEFARPSMAAPVTAEARPEAPPVAEAPATGPVARVRQAIANRAAAEVTDTMRTGMDSWGAPAKSWAPGWSRHPDGYTRTGELALFSPSMTYANYRLEFFGQIENKGMGWVVRAQDKQNYYAMKFKVVEAGLRPVIAMVHYAVVKGRKGHTVDTTLSTMVHRNMPFRVSVDVHGSRLTAAIEGQQVDSWTDDLLASGGVGFFSEAGERARLYWMKVSKNQDWLGLVCSFIAGGDSAQKAELRMPGIPAGVPQPAAPEYTPDAVLAEAETSHGFTGGPQRARIWIRGRIRPWRC